MRPVSRSLTQRCKVVATRSIYTQASNRELFEYTSGRFLFNEELRLAERRVPFVVDALATAVCKSVNRPKSSLYSITKLAEGGFNRVIQATFEDGLAVLARLPYKTTVPKHHATASEAATLGLLRAHGIPVPKVLACSPDSSNDVGVEYMLCEKMEGSPLSEIWFSMDTKAQVRMMRQIIALEKKYMTIEFPASGSLFYRKDLTGGFVPIPGQDEIVVGQTAQHAWWYRERALLDVDRGPWDTFRSCFEAPAIREIEFCKTFGKPRLHAERILREIHQFKEMSPAVHEQLLSDYLQLAPHLALPPGHPLSRPTLRHPDFSPNNILITTSNEIVSLIDWQHAAILPLCLCAGILSHFQTWGDPFSENLAKPDLELPSNFPDLDPAEQMELKETMRKRLVHFYYAASTMKAMPHHFKALRNENCMLRAKLFDRAAVPWEGDSVSLRYTMMQVCQAWPMSISGDDDLATKQVACPLSFSEEETQRCTNEHQEQEEKMQELIEMREYINIDSLGWAEDDEQLEKSRGFMRTIREQMLEHSETEVERVAVREHFPFDDHEESG